MNTYDSRSDDYSSALGSGMKSVEHVDANQCPLGLHLYNSQMFKHGVRSQLNKMKAIGHTSIDLFRGPQFFKETQ